MNKTALKNFAVWARNKLIADITYKAGLMGIAEDGIKAALPQSTEDTEFYDIGTKEPYLIVGEAVKQRRRLVELINRKTESSDYKTAFHSVVEEVAYTWFNRLIAIRFMEVNDYLPSHIRVLSSESANKLEPDLVTTPFDADLELTEAEKAEIIRLKNDNQVDALFRMLFIKQCNTMNTLLPKLFEKTADYSELLLNVSVTDQDGVVYHLVHDIPEDDFNIEKGGQVEIIGWLYQYYNTEPKDETFALLKKNVKITKERIPSATQLFTPDWIVRYMVENSLGRLWLEGHPNDSLKSGWKYYLDEAKQEPEVQAQLDKIREEYKTIKPEDIKVIDPCMGSGHILVYAFDVLMQIYETAGYSQWDAAKSILEHNLYGLDIDDRAFQLAYFAVMMKARQYNRFILNGDAVCHVYSIQESNGFNPDYLKLLGSDDLKAIAEKLIDVFTDAKEYGSILNVDIPLPELEALRQRIDEISKVHYGNFFDSARQSGIVTLLVPVVQQAIVMAQKYDVVVTNPPYMASSNMNGKLSDYTKKAYAAGKSDLFGVFISRCESLTLHMGYFSLITQHTWMFLGSYENLRQEMLQNDFVSLAHFGIKAFEEIGNDVVQTCSFVIKKQHTPRRKALFCRLVDYKDYQQKEQEFHNSRNYYAIAADSFELIPGSPFAYWVSKNFIENFSIGKRIEDYGEFTGSQNITGNNEKYLRCFWEISQLNINTDYWVFYAKGGDYRKYYGNLEMVVDWRQSGKTFYRTNKTSNLLNKDYWFREGITYSAVTSRGTGFRYLPKNCIFDKGGPSISIDRRLPEILALLNSKVAELYFSVFNPSINLQVKDIKAFPIILPEDDELRKLACETIQIAKEDWDAFETSFEFSRHPLVTTTSHIQEAFFSWRDKQLERQFTIKHNEERCNQIIASLYHMSEINISFENRDFPVTLANESRDIRSLISYAVGCMFGRYSLYKNGLFYAGGRWDSGSKIDLTWDLAKRQGVEHPLSDAFIPDYDNIIPITDEEYFKDDIVGKFVEFVKVIYGAETLEENLDFIAKALGNKGNTSREIIRNYFLNDFFKDHCATYSVTGSGKRPIYWLFDSGKQNGFKALIYMHRYHEDTIGNLRIDYLHRMERVYESEISRMQDTIDNSANAREVTAATKRKEKLQKQIKECKDYDEKIAHLALARITIDLDDGVKVNYEKVQTDTDDKFYQVLAKI